MQGKGTGQSIMMDRLNVQNHRHGDGAPDSMHEGEGRTEGGAVE
jgi:hypothetical protein